MLKNSILKIVLFFIFIFLFSSLISLFFEWLSSFNFNQEKRWTIAFVAFIFMGGVVLYYEHTRIKNLGIEKIIVKNILILNGTGIAEWLPEAASKLEKNGKIIIYATANNKLCEEPSTEFLNNLGLRVLENRKPTFSTTEDFPRVTDGVKIPPKKILCTILEKID